MELVPFVVVLGAVFFMAFFAGRRRVNARRGRSDSLLDSSVYPSSDTSATEHPGHHHHHHHHDAGSHSHGHDGGFSHGGGDFGSGHGGGGHH
jgi:ABC-type nickel/cobalt efflux system permease component RcnA